MKTSYVDTLNILLMVLSAILAFFFPFGIFLFSYAILGPLHYLTEISWLHQKNYFTRLKLDYIFLLACGIMLFIFYLSKGANLLNFSANIMFIAFFGSIILATTKSIKIRVVAFAIIAATAFLIKNSSALFAIFAILLPTVIHVFFFTTCFILHGALKNRSLMGLASIIIFFLCIATLVFVTTGGNNFTVGSFVRQTYQSFESVNLKIMDLINIRNQDIQQAIYNSAEGLSVMRFIAFVYLYHYLNWFSKTKVIRWHLMPRQKLVFILLLWLLAITLYLYNYSFGLVALYFLSLLHVLLEFPLNQVTFIGIFKETKNVLLQFKSYNS